MSLLHAQQHYLSEKTQAELKELIENDKIIPNGGIHSNSSVSETEV